MDINSSTQEQPVTTVKGFDQNLRCRGYQFEVGQTYTHEGTVEVCKSGFHAVEYALDVFGYYPPGDSRYCVVAQSGQIGRQDDDSKIVSASITIQAEIKLPQLIQRGVDWIMAHLEPTKTEANTGTRSAATNTGNRSAATNTGEQSAASVEGPHSVALSAGLLGRAKASEGSAIVLVDRGEDGVIRHIRCAIAGQEVKADTWYTLNDLGEFEEVENV